MIVKLMLNLESRGLHRSTNPNEEDFRLSLNSISRESSGITAETAKIINSEITTQI